MAGTLPPLAHDGREKNSSLHNGPQGTCPIDVIDLSKCERQYVIINKFMELIT